MSKEITLEQAGREIANTCKLKERRFFFMIGAGVSAPEVPLATGIIKELSSRYSDLKCDPNLPAMDAYAWWLSNVFSSKGDRQAYFRSLIDGKNLTHAHLRLAHILIARKAASLVVTVNFDDFLTRAIQLLGGQCVVCDHNATIERIDPESEEIQIVHVHGSHYFYDLRNLPQEIEEQAERAEERAYSIRDFMEGLLSTRSPIVVGYSGWESDVFMQALRRKLTSPRKYNIYWFCYRRSDRDSLPKWLVDHGDVRLVMPRAAPRDAGPAAPDAGAAASRMGIEGPPGQFAQGDRTKEDLLPAAAVFDELIRTLKLAVPDLVADPLRFLAEHLERSLPCKLGSEQAADIYSLANVMEDIRRARNLFEDNKEQIEKHLEKLRDALRRSEYQEAATLSQHALELELNAGHLRELLEMAWKAAVGLYDGSEGELRAYDAVVQAADHLEAGDSGDLLSRARLAQALYNKGWRLAQLGRNEEAVVALQEVFTRFSEAEPLELREPVARALGHRGWSLTQLNRVEEAIASFDEVVKRFGDAKEPELQQHVAEVMLNKGMTLSQKGQRDQAMALFDQVVQNYGEASALPLRLRVAWTLANKAWVLGLDGRHAEALSVYAEIVSRHGEAAEAELRHQVALALDSQAQTLRQLDRRQEEIAAYDDLIVRFGEASEPALREQAAAAMINKGITLTQLGRSEEAIAVYDDVVKRYGEASELGLREQAARALNNKGVELGQRDRAGEAIAVFEEVVKRCGQASEPALLDQASKALLNSSVALRQLGRRDEEIAVYDEVIKRYQGADAPGLRERVARALANKGAALTQTNRIAESVGVFEEVVTRYGEASETGLRELVAQSLVNKGVALGQLNRGEEAIAVFDELVRRYGDSEEDRLREPVARALVNKGTTLAQLGRGEEEIQAYDEVVKRFGEAGSAELQEQVARALVNKGIALGKANRAPEETAVYEEVMRRYGKATGSGLRQQVAAAFNGIGFRRLLQGKQMLAEGDKPSARAVLEQSRADLSEAVERAPQIGTILGNLGYVYFLLGNLEAARENLQKALASGGEEIRQVELADSEVNPIPEDVQFRELVRSLPLKQEEPGSADGATVATAVSSPGF